MLNAMLDTNIFDRLLIQPASVDFLNNLVRANKVQLFITAVQRNQINQASDETKRNALLSILERLHVQKIPVEFAPYGYVYGECYGGLSPDVTLDREDFIKSNNKHIEDAIIAATASSKKYQMDYVVTDDKGFRKRLNRQQSTTKAITFEKFKAIAVQLQITAQTTTLAH